MLILVHMLQNYVPSNLNRDLGGSPKDARFGGYTRARISSQCIKRSIRASEEFKNLLASHSGLMAWHTRKLPERIEESMKRKGNVGEATINAIAQRMKEFGKGKSDGSESRDEDNKLQTDQLLVFTQEEVDRIAEAMLDVYERTGFMTKKQGKDTPMTMSDIDTKAEEYFREKKVSSWTPTQNTIDIAMFGRMSTSKLLDQIDGSVQVAHAISTHAIEKEVDFFAAVDDLADEPGAGIISENEFNSATYYKYFSIHWDDLVKNLNHDLDLARIVVAAFIEVACLVHPTGKKGSHAQDNMPDVVVLEVRQRNLGISYANAFQKPVYPSGHKSLIELSVERLGNYIPKVNSAYNLEAERAHFSVEEYELADSGKVTSIRALLDWLKPRLIEPN